MGYLPWAVLELLLVLIVFWALRKRKRSGSAAAPDVLAEELRTYDRALALFTTPNGTDAKIALRGGAMEVSRAGAALLVVALRDGRVALYPRDGPSMHGLGAIPAVQQASEAFRDAIESHQAHFLPEEGGRGPEHDGVVIRTRTDRGGFAVRLPVEESGKHPCADVLRRGLQLRDAILANAR
jgi:hypothetical protein